MKPRSATPRHLPDFVEPMKAKLVDSMPSGDWIYEIKFDGYRALALRGGGETRVLSRNQKDLGGKFPEVKDSVFYAFDLIQLNGKDLRLLLIEERKAKLEELLKKPPGVIRHSVSFTKDIEELISKTGILST